MRQLDCDSKTDVSQRELVTHGSFSFPIACYDEALSNARIPWHWHEEWEFILVTKGSIVVRLENTEISIPCGDGLFINSEVLHTIDSARSRDGAIHSAVFHPRLIGGTVESVYWEKLVQPFFRESSPLYLFLTRDDPAHARALGELRAAWDAVAFDREDCENTARFLLSRAWRTLSRLCAQSSIERTARDRMDGERIRAMLTFIDTHIARELSTKRIAKSVNVSESVCLKCFHRMLGLTPMQYVKQSRLEKAAKLLRGSSAAIQTIAWECGFRDVSYFTKSFREKMGCTPKEYRRRANAAE